MFCSLKKNMDIPIFLTIPPNKIISKRRPQTIPTGKLIGYIKIPFDDINYLNKKKVV